MSATDANRELLRYSARKRCAACLLARCARRRAFVYKTGFHLYESARLLLHMKFVHRCHGNLNLHQTTGRERGVVDSTRVRGGDPTARKADSLVAHDNTMNLGHHPLQRAQGPKRELVTRGPRGGEERHDEPKGVEK